MGQEGNDILQPLRDAVIKQIQDHCIETVVVLDDQLAEGVSTSAWMSLTEQLADPSNSALREQVEEVVERTSGRMDQMPDADTLDSIVKLLEDNGDRSLTERLSPRSDPGESLKRLIGCIEGLGLEVCKFSGMSTSIPRDARLYFVDYRISEEPTEAGSDAIVLLASILEGLNDTDVPPLAVLMSRADDRGPAAGDRARILEESGFVGLNYTYLDKSELADDTAELSFLCLMHELLENGKAGADYFRVVRKLGQRVDSNAKLCVRRLMTLVPSDFSAFAEPLSDIPDDRTHKSAEHIHGLLVQLFGYSLQRDQEGQQAIKAFASTLLQETSSVAPGTIEGHQLHQLHADLLYDRSESTCKGRPDFGDIYQKKGSSVDQYYLLITPECDLVPRPTREGGVKPKAERLLFLEGNTVDKEPSFDQATVALQLFRQESDNALRWLVWQLRCPVIVELGELTASFRKVARLRLQEAEDVQQRYAADILAVGTDDISGPVSRIEAHIWKSDNESEEPTHMCSFGILELQRFAKSVEPLWSLQHGEHLKLCGEAAICEIVAPEQIPGLRRYQTAKEFAASIEQKQGRGRKVFVKWHEGVANFIVSSSGRWPKGWIPQPPETKG